MTARGASPVERSSSVSWAVHPPTDPVIELSGVRPEGGGVRPARRALAPCVNRDQFLAPQQLSEAVRAIRTMVSDVDRALSDLEAACATFAGSVRVTATVVPAAAWHRLTPRQRQVATLIANGTTNRELARLLHVTEHTAKSHTRAVLAKLGLHSRCEVAYILPFSSIG